MATGTIAYDPEKAALAAEVLKALAHPLRIQIIALLCAEEELAVKHLAERLDVAPAIVSQQLRILRNKRLVAARRLDGLAWYRIQQPLLRTLIRCMEGCDAA